MKQWFMRNNIVFDLNLYEPVNKSYRHFSNSMHKCIKSLLMPLWHPARNGHLTMSILVLQSSRLHHKWHCNMVQKIRHSLLRRLLHITSLSVDSFEYYLTLSFSITVTVLYLNLNLKNSATRRLKRAPNALPTLLYVYETSFWV